MGAGGTTAIRAVSRWVSDMRCSVRLRSGCVLPRAGTGTDGVMRRCKDDGRGPDTSRAIVPAGAPVGNKGGAGIPFAEASGSCGGGAPSAVMDEAAASSSPAAVAAVSPSAGAASAFAAS